MNQSAKWMALIFLVTLLASLSACNMAQQPKGQSYVREEPTGETTETTGGMMNQEGATTDQDMGGPTGTTTTNTTTGTMNQPAGAGSTDTSTKDTETPKAGSGGKSMP